MFRIGEFSKMGKTTIKALRYYDELGLLKPEYADPFTSYRFYTSRQLVELHRIHSLRQVGLSLDEIRLVLAGQSPKMILRQRRHELLGELSVIQDQLSRLDFILECQETLMMHYVAAIKELPACFVYTKRFTAPTHDSYFELIPAIGQQLATKYPDLKCATPAYCYLVYLDGEYKERDIRLELCEAVTELRPDFDDVTFKKVEATTALSVMHKGPYSAIPQAYAFGMKWIEENGYVMTHYTRESYIDGIWNKEDEADWLTELQFPIVKK